MSETELATFGGGCFWCVEAAFERVRGVREVVSGYAGGHTEDPSYREVCSGSTGHAEVVQVAYDPDAVSYEDLLEVFFTIHDPTTKDRQGPDVGSQYRSIVPYHGEAQREAVEDYIEELEASGEYEGVVTEVTRLETFYRAEDKHQDYFEKNPDQPYCRMQIPPKLEKLESKHADKLAPEAPGGD
jgi:peptide-methionine (S)-S-oxide reductase